MENFLAPAARFMYPELARGELVTAVRPDVAVAFVAARDIGRIAARAFADPAGFAGAEIDLVSDRLTLPQVAQHLARASGRRVYVRNLSPQELARLGYAAGWIETQVWLNAIGERGLADSLGRWGLEPTTFAAWATANAGRLRAEIDAGPEIAAP